MHVMIVSQVDALAGAHTGAAVGVPVLPAADAAGHSSWHRHLERSKMWASHYQSKGLEIHACTY
jgi:hypothetical protein